MYKHPPLDLLHMADVVEDTTAIANIMGAFTFLNCYKQHKRQFENWSHNEPTLTLNGGKYVGYEAVKEFFVDYNEAQTRWANETMRKLFPEELGGKSDEEIWAVGSNTVLTMTTPIIEVAFDGQTAKGMWYVFGETTEVYSKGPKAAWNFGKCAVDFIKEDGEWKIWHFFVGTDFSFSAGTKYEERQMGPAPERPKQYGVMRIPGLYTSRYNWSQYPHWPVPYETWTPEISYGPEAFMKEGE